MYCQLYLLIHAQNAKQHMHNFHTKCHLVDSRADPGFFQGGGRGAHWYIVTVQLAKLKAQGLQGSLGGYATQETLAKNAL